MKIVFCILTLGLLSLFNRVAAQSYIPFPDSNCVWSVGTKKFLMKGDSILSTITYKKYYESDDTLLSQGSLNFVGLVRQDVSQKKIYGVAKNQTNERLLYNFNLNVNDGVAIYSLVTFTYSGNTQGPYNLYVIGKDSVQINGIYRKRFIFYSGLSQNEYWIEGIGSNFGPLLAGISTNLDGTDDYVPPCVPELLCQKTGTIMSYINPKYNTCYSDTAFVYNCKTRVGVNEYFTKIKLSVFPTPSEDKVTIEFEPALADNANVKIYNSMSQLVFSKENFNSSQQLDISFLPKGIYHLTLQNGSVQKTIKLIKQ